MRMLRLAFGVSTVDGGIRARHRQRDLDRYRPVLDWLNEGWEKPYIEAEQRIVQAVDAGSGWAFIRLPFPFTLADADRAERVMDLAHSHRFALRPGGAAGPSADIIRLERDA